MVIHFIYIDSLALLKFASAICLLFTPFKRFNNKLSLF